MNFKMIVSGDGGQGIQTIAKIISDTAFGKNYEVSSIPNYGLEQRGGVSLNYVQISDEKIFYPKFDKADFLLILSKQAVERTQDNVGSITKVIDIENYKEFFTEQKISRTSYNIFFLGLISKYLEEKNILTRDDIFSYFEKKLSGKSNWEENKKVFDIGYNVN